jgi:hypothetical protein
LREVAEVSCVARSSIGKKEGLAIALVTATITSPYYHEEQSSWHLL